MIKRKPILLFSLVMLIVGFSQFTIIAEETSSYSVFLNEEHITDETINIKGTLFIKAKSLEELFDIDYDFSDALEAVELSSDDLLIRMMIGSPYIQFNESSKTVDHPPKMINEQPYVPLKPISDELGAFIEYQEDNNEIHIHAHEPQFTIKKFDFPIKENRVQIKMDDIPPYRIAIDNYDSETSEDTLIIEFQKAKIGNDFDKSIDHNDYWGVVEQYDTLKLKLKSNKKSILPKYEGIYEDDNSLFIELAQTEPHAFNEVTVIGDNIYFSEKQAERGYGGVPVRFALIHPNRNIPYRSSLSGIEENLKEDYDLVRVNIRPGNNFNLYQFKNNFKLTVDNKTVKSIDFYDIRFSPSARKYWSDISADYSARASLSITGYLLFPKTIDENSKNIKLEGNDKSIFSENGVKWDFEEINDFIEIMKN